MTGGSHAARLSGELESARDAARAKLAEVSPEIAADGFALSVESWSDEPGYKLAVQSLDSSGAKLLSVIPGTDQSPERAVVWLPFGEVGTFFTKIEQFATETTSRGQPEEPGARRQHRRTAPGGAARPVAGARGVPRRRRGPLVGGVAGTSRADALPPGEAKRTTLDTSARQLAGGPARSCARSQPSKAWQMVPGLLAFPDNVVALVRASASELGTLLSTSAVPSELHRARVTSEIFGLDPLDQDEWVADLEGRIEAAEPDAAAVCVLDTGLMSAHPLLRASVDRALSALDGEGPGDQAGHGTAMAGLALFRDLDRDLIGNGRRLAQAPHRIGQGTPRAPRHDERPGDVPDDHRDRDRGGRGRRRSGAVCSRWPSPRTAPMARTADPTSYSAALDALAFGTDIARSDDGIELLGQPDPHAARLFVLSAGNVPADQWTTDHLALSDVAAVQNPAQAWNALTVGAYTEKVTPPTGRIVPWLGHGRDHGRTVPVQPHVHDLRPRLANQARHRLGRAGTCWSTRVALSSTSTTTCPCSRREMPPPACSPLPTRPALPPRRPRDSPRSRWSSTRAYGRRRCVACWYTRPNGRRPCGRTSVPQGPKRANASSCCGAMAGACPPRNGYSAARPAP